MEKIAIFPGSFDPYTIGHADITERALTIFDKVIIAVGHNENKRTRWSTGERIAALQALYAGNDRVSIEAYSDLTIDLARRYGARAIVRGVRIFKDFEYEQSIADINRQLAPEVETVLFYARPELASVSSSVVCELLHFGKDVSSLLPRGYHLPPR